MIIIYNHMKKHIPLSCKESEVIMYKASNSSAGLSSKLSPIFKEKNHSNFKRQKNPLPETKEKETPPQSFCEVRITLIQNM